MNYPFDALKATQVVALLAIKEGGEINIMKAVKLVYLLDRLSLDRRGIPVLGGDYFSMRNGPVTSELLDLINSGTLYGVDTDWQDVLTDRVGHKIAVADNPGTGRLCLSEIDLINSIYAQHGAKDEFELRDWCHDNLPEWHRITAGRREIPVESIWEATGKPEDEIKHLLNEARELANLDALLA